MRALGVAVATVLAAGLLTGCGNDGKDKAVATVSGNCALEKDKYQVSPISAELLEKTLGDGSYRLSGDVHGAGTAEDPINGGCTYSSVDDDGKLTLRLQLAVDSKGQPYSSYEDQVKKLASGSGITKLSGVQGYTQVEKNQAYGGGSGEGGAGVIIDGDMVYGATIVVPGKGIDGKQACEELVRATAKALGKPLQGK